MKRTTILVGGFLASIGFATDNVRADGGPSVRIFASTENWAHDEPNCPGRLVTWNSLSGLTTLWSANDQNTFMRTLEIDPIAERLYFGFGCESSKFDFSDRQFVVTPVWGCLGNAVDPLGRMFYWLDRIDGNFVIRRVDLDGGVPQDLVTSPIVTGLGLDFDLEIDPCNEKLYWTNYLGGQIQRADLSGSNVETVLTTSAFRLELDHNAGKMYWMGAAKGVIKRANLDGSHVETITIPGGYYQDLALDRAGEWIYCVQDGGYCSSTVAQIVRVDFAGENFEVVFSVTGAGSGIALANSALNGAECTPQPTCVGVNDCSGNGKCVAFDTCECNSGWEGADCATFNCIDFNNCSAQGTCVGANNCECNEGFAGANCSVIIPAVSAWGLAVMILLLGIAGTVMIRKQVAA